MGEDGIVPKRNFCPKQKDFKHDEEIVRFSAFYFINFYVLNICTYVFSRAGTLPR